MRRLIQTQISGLFLSSCRMFPLPSQEGEMDPKPGRNVEWGPVRRGNPLIVMYSLTGWIEYFRNSKMLRQAFLNVCGIFNCQALNGTRDTFGAGHFLKAISIGLVAGGPIFGICGIHRWFQKCQRFIGVNPKYWTAAKPGGTFFEIWPWENAQCLLNPDYLLYHASGFSKTWYSSFFE